MILRSVTNEECSKQAFLELSQYFIASVSTFLKLVAGAKFKKSINVSQKEIELKRTGLGYMSLKRTFELTMSWMSDNIQIE